MLGEWWNRAECDAHQAKRRWAGCGVGDLSVAAYETVHESMEIERCY